MWTNTLVGAQSNLHSVMSFVSIATTLINFEKEVSNGKKTSGYGPASPTPPY